jgi:hypothetical protein
MLLAGSSRPTSSRPTVEPPRAAAEPGQVEAEPAPSTVWRRIVLGPGVELHYQVTGDRQRSAAVGRLIREAARILGEGPPAGPRDRLGF